MRICVPLETTPGELRVAMTPDMVSRLGKLGIEVAIESGAGARAGFRDEAYLAAGASILPVDAGDAPVDCAAMVRVQPPSLAEVDRIPQGATLISLMRPATSADLVARLRSRGIHGLALELVPRITRAQSMDVLSSQATVAGYKAVLMGAERLPKFLPMLTTAAGNVQPARTFVIGAGVAGLMAIATARRLGAVVSAFDVRPAVREQVQSLGATFVAAELASADAEAAGGYAREQSADEQARIAGAIGAHIREMDLVVTTAQIPGRPAPKLIPAAMLPTMRPGSVIVDLAAESGGNCEATVPGETITADGVTVMAPLNVPATVPYHASQMFARNVFELLKHLVKDGRIVVDAADEITGPMLLTR